MKAENGGNMGKNIRNWRIQMAIFGTASILAFWQNCSQVGFQTIPDGTNSKIGTFDVVIPPSTDGGGTGSVDTGSGGGGGSNGETPPPSTDSNNDYTPPPSTGGGGEDVTPPSTDVGGEVVTPPSTGGGGGEVVTPPSSGGGGENSPPPVAGGNNEDKDHQASNDDDNEHHVGESEGNDDDDDDGEAEDDDGEDNSQPACNISVEDIVVNVDFSCGDGAHESRLTPSLSGKVSLAKLVREGVVVTSDSDVDSGEIRMVFTSGGHYLKTTSGQKLDLVTSSHETSGFHMMVDEGKVAFKAGKKFRIRAEALPQLKRQNKGCRLHPNWRGISVTPEQ